MSMNNTARTVVTVLVTVLVVASTAWAQWAAPNSGLSKWAAPTAVFPDNGGIVAPLDEGNKAQTRGGVIDFSSSTQPFPLSFGASQGISVLRGQTLNIGGGNLGLLDGNLIFSPSAAFHGITFPDTSVQVTSASGQLGYGKVCSIVVSGNWRDTMMVPNDFTRAACVQWATAAGASVGLPGCITSSSVWLAASSGGVPSPNCHWDVPPPVVRPPAPSCGGFDNAIWTGTRWVCPSQCNIPQDWKCPQIP